MKEINGISVEIIDSKENLLLIEEGEKKQWKNPGQLSTPMGTCEKNESSIETAIRELKEEVGLIIEKKDLINKGIFIMYVNGIKIIINKYQLTISEKIKKTISIKNNNEVKKIIWVKKQKLKNYNIEKIRPGTIETIDNNQNNRSFIVLIENGIYHPNTHKSLKLNLNNF